MKTHKLKFSSTWNPLPPSHHKPKNPSIHPFLRHNANPREQIETKERERGDGYLSFEKNEW